MEKVSGFIQKREMQRESKISSFDVNQGNEEAGWVYEFLLRLGMERLSLHLLLAVKNIVCASEVGCGSV